MKLGWVMVAEGGAAAKEAGGTALCRLLLSRQIVPLSEPLLTGVPFSISNFDVVP